MSKKLVIMASKEGREALRACGVLPASVFKDFAEIDEHDYDRSLSKLAEDRADAGTSFQVSANEDKRLVEYAASLGFYVWPHDPDYKCAASGFGDYPLLSMLGMEPPKNNAEYLERKIAYTKLLGSTILHVILLDEFDLGGKTSKPSPCSISPVLKWCDTFQNEILKEYSEEQTTGIEHVFILVARNPNGLEVNSEEVESFCRRLNAPEANKDKKSARIRTCFFLDRNLEIELEDQLFPSAFVWSQMVGRLLIRILIGLEQSPKDPIGWCDGGIRLWKSSEFVLDFQRERVHKLMSEGINSFINELRTGESSKDAKLSLSPWVPSVDRVLRSTPKWTWRGKCPWNTFRAEACCKETFNEYLWRSLLCPLKADTSVPAAKRDIESNSSEHAGDVDVVRMRLTNEVHRLMTSADAVYAAVHEWVDKTSKEVKDFFSKSIGKGVSEYWDNIVKLCFRRAQCKDVFDDVVGDYELAKKHYVQKKHCLLAVLAVSLCSGLVFSRLVIAFGGGLLFALMLCGGALAGGLFAMYLTQHFHNKYGRRGQESLLRLCDDADKCIIARDKCAHDQIKKAVEVRARMLQLAKMRHFESLITRLQQMINNELVAPSSEVFLEDDLPELTEDDRVTNVLKAQYERFIAETNFRIGFNVKKDESAQVRVSFPEECESVKTSWTTLCAKHDPRSTANFPARYFVPFLRRTLKNFRNKYRPEVWRSLTEDSITELIAKFQQAVARQEDKYEIPRRIRQFVADDTWYSAHIDFEYKYGIASDVEFFYAPIFDSNQWGDVKELWGGIDGIVDQPSRFLLGRTPHFAMLFAQSQVNFTVKDNRLALRVAGDREEDDNV